MNFKVVLIEKISSKGKPYKVLEVIFPSGYVKNVFLDSAELHLLEINHANIPNFKKD